MTSPAHGALRLLRGGVLTAVATLCALAGHVVAGGAILGLAALVVAGWLGAAFVLLADRRRGFADILVASFAAQVVFHVIFAITCHGSQGPAPLLPDAPMVAGHAAAAACLAGLLAYGERVLWGLYHAFRLVAGPSVASPVVPHTTSCSPAHNRVAVLRFRSPDRRPSRSRPTAHRPPGRPRRRLPLREPSFRNRKDCVR